MGSCISDSNPTAQPEWCANWCPGYCSWRGRGCCVCCRAQECCHCCTRSPTGDRGLESHAEAAPRPIEGLCCADCRAGEGVHQGRGAPPMRPARPRVARLRVIIIIVGSRGDVQPFVAFAMGLRRHGHSVCLATHEKSFSWAHNMCVAEGIKFYDIGGNPEMLMQYAVEHPNLISFNLGQVRKQQGIMREIFGGSHLACEWFKPDVIVANPPLQVHTHLAEKHKTPLQIHFTMPWSPTNVYSHPCSPGAGIFGNRESYHILDELQWVGLKAHINAFRSESLGLPQIPVRGSGLQHKMEIPHIYCASPQLMPKPMDWGAHISVVGFWNLPQGSDVFDESHRDWDTGLWDFLQKSNRDDLVYIGFGSIQTQDPRELSASVMKGIELVRQKRPGLRVLLSPGWAGLGENYRKVSLHVEDFDDIGMTFSGTTVTEVAEGSLAEKAGIEGGKVDGVPRTRVLRIGVGDEPMKRVFQLQEIEAALDRAAELQLKHSSGEASRSFQRIDATTSAPAKAASAVAPAKVVSSKPPVYKSVTSIGSRHQRSADSLPPTPGSLEGMSTVRVRFELGISGERPDYVYLVGRCPHDWLFPRCRAVVHHGGAGTTATGLLAKCCTCVVPFFGDQPFWGSCCEKQGVGPVPIPVKEVTDKKLSAAIEQMMGVPGEEDTKNGRATAEMWQRVSDLSAALRRENGVDLGVQAFHLMLDLEPSGLQETVWQNEVFKGGRWCPSHRDSGWPPWSDRTGWMEYHRNPDADMSKPPSADEINLGEDWIATEWKVWDSASVKKETQACGGVHVPLDPDGWQYAFNFRKQATDGAWHGERHSNDVCRRRRWRMEKRRVPPILFLSPGVHKRSLLGYYMRVPGQREWQQLVAPVREPMSRDSTHSLSSAEPFGESREHRIFLNTSGCWVIADGSSPLYASAGGEVGPALVPAGSWRATGHLQESLGGSGAGSGIVVTEPSDFEPGEVAERARVLRRSPAIWERVVVARRHETHRGYYYVTPSEGGPERLVEAMKLRRPADPAQLALPAYYSTQLTVIQHLDEESDAESEGADAADADAVMAAVEDGALDLLGALVKTSSKDRIEQLTTAADGVSPLRHAQATPGSDLRPLSSPGRQTFTSPFAHEPDAVLPRVQSQGESDGIVTPRSGSGAHRLLSVGSSFARRHQKSARFGSQLRSPTRPDGELDQAERCKRARDASMLLLQTAVWGELRCIRCPEERRAFKSPQSDKPTGTVFPAGSHVLVLAVERVDDDVWAKVVLRTSEDSMSASDAAAAAAVASSQPDEWIRVTDILGTVDADEDELVMPGE